MKRTYIRDDRGVALYNCNKKELIGFFNSFDLATKYLYDNTKLTDATENRVHTAVYRKERIKNSRFPFMVAVRFLKEDQREELSGRSHLIKNSYPDDVTQRQIKGFHSLPNGYINPNPKGFGKRPPEKDIPSDCFNPDNF